MEKGELSDFFIGVGTKSLKGTEVDPSVSRGHELQGVNDFRVFLGSPAENVKLQVTYVWLSDETEPESLTHEGTWYNSRKAQEHREPEYRLYYPSAAQEIVYRAKAGDRLFLCQPRSGPLLALFCAQESSIEQQLLWLFGLERTANTEITQIDLRSRKRPAIDIAGRYVLELINVEVISTEEPLLDKILEKFGEKFPPTRPFSEFARNLAPDIDCLANPDLALVEWMDLEERLFRTLERHIVGKRLEQGFLDKGKPDVDGFVEFSLKVQNRRKSRAGWAFGNHIEALLLLHKIQFVREATTEKRNGPDFLFPNEAQYHNSAFPTEQLTMLGAKTSCKDRWRQVLAEADRIQHKHLLTLEPSISSAQTDEMLKEKLQLVLPKGLHSSYRPEQQKELLSVAEFLELILKRQV